MTKDIENVGAVFLWTLRRPR